MKVPLSWLKEFVDLKDITAEEIANKLTAASVEVEGIETAGGDVEGVCVGKVVAKEQHPDADKLSVCRVNVGDLGEKTIVCGAANVRADAFVPVATVGTTLPGGMTIRKAELRGVVSEGMICSKQELALEEASEGIWLLPEKGIAPGDPIGKVIGEKDYILNIDITANRGDLLSVTGIAREIAAIVNRRYHIPKAFAFESASGNINIRIENSEGCPRYSARLIKGVTIGPSPEWMVRRLERSGLRSINNVVDVTNYVLLEYGQPLHAFDLGKLSGEQIVVRNAKEGEEITVIDGSKHKLNEEVLVIADGENPVAVAGVMGGANTEVDENTTDLLIESACFNPVTIRMSSKHLGLKSDSSYRFERGIDPQNVVNALNRAVELIVNEVGAGGTVSSKVKDVYPKPNDAKVFIFHSKQASEFLGIEVDRVIASNLFKRLGFSVANSGSDSLRVDVPFRRRDITQEVDLIEEVARIHGYNEIPARLPRIVSNTVDSDYNAVSRVKHWFVGAGFYQAINFSMGERAVFEKAGFDANTFIPITHPISRELDILRPTLFVDLMRTFRHNKHRGKSGGAYFEVGATFRKEGEEFVEEKQIAGLLAGEKGEKRWNEPSAQYDFYDASGVLEAFFTNHLSRDDFRFVIEEQHPFLPTVSAAVYLGDTKVGAVGEVHPSVAGQFDVSERVFYFTLSFPPLLDVVKKAVFYQSIHKFPPVFRDLALVCDKDFSFDMALRRVASFDTLITNVRVVDVYEGEQVPEGKRSIAISLVYNDPERTLKEEEVDAVEKRLLDVLYSEFGITIRA